MFFEKLLRWLNREKMAVLIAAIAFLGGAVSPWYLLPSETLNAFGANLNLASTGRLVAFFFSFELHYCLALGLRVY